MHIYLFEIFSEVSNNNQELINFVQWFKILKVEKM